MTITRIAMPNAQALPSTLEERLAKIRKASLITQKKSRDSFCCLSFSFCVFIVLILLSAPTPAGRQRLYVPTKNYRAAHRAACASTTVPLTTENQTEHETDSERGEDRLRRVFADVLL